jgi:hypothetical protein
MRFLFDKLRYILHIVVRRHDFFEELALLEP